MGLKDILFGKEVQISDTKLGVLKARIKKTHPSINYVWASEVLLSEQQNETVIILEGNSEGPFKKQLESAYSIVDNLTNIQEQIIVESKKNKNKIKYNGDWIKQFVTNQFAKNTTLLTISVLNKRVESDCWLTNWKFNVY